MNERARIHQLKMRAVVLGPVMQIYQHGEAASVDRLDFRKVHHDNAGRFLLKHGIAQNIFLPAHNSSHAFDNGYISGAITSYGKHD
jgi:hypothetical protein